MALKKNQKTIDKEKKGIDKMAKHFHCPVNGWDCPYYKDEPNNPCLCTMTNPYAECDDFAYSWEGYEEEEYTDDHD